MSLIKSHHINMNEENVLKSQVSLDTIREITDFVLKNFAPLIVDIEMKKANKFLLEKEIIAYLDGAHQFQLERERAIRDVMDYMFGYGPLQTYIEDDDVSDIDILKYDFVMIKRYGKKEIVPLSFGDEESFLNFSKLVIIRNGGIINEKDCHARVSDAKHKLRINVTIGPRNVSGPSMTIRKHRQASYGLTDLRNLNMIDLKTEDLLRKLMSLSTRLLIVGKGAAGKTTLLRALLKEVPYTERFLICESDSELYPDQSNFIVQKVQGHNKETSLKDLIMDGLTMSLDGYCIGELVGGEVYEFLKAGYTDHRVMGTIHGQSTYDTISRIKSMLKEHQRFIDDDYIGGAIDLIIYVKKFKVIEICEVARKDKDIIFNTLMTFDIKKENDFQLIGDFQMKNPLKYKLKREWERRCQ